LEVVVHGIQLDRVRARRENRCETRRELGVSDGDVLVGTVGNVRPQKRYPDLLAAAGLALDASATVRFAAAGSGSDEPEITRLHGQLGLGDRFRFLGYVEDAPRFLSACDVFVLASEYEGLPVAMMEALALGLPIVATAVPGIVGEVEDGVEAVLVPPHRPDLLADAIVTLADDPARRASMAEASRARSEGFDLAGAVRRLEEIYRDVSHRS
jgi:glycosyltransferase involved in cell wall biosynthesis